MFDLHRTVHQLSLLSMRLLDGFQDGDIVTCDNTVDLKMYVCY